MSGSPSPGGVSVRSKEPEFKPTAATLCNSGQAAEPLWAPAFLFVSQHDDNSNSCLSSVRITWIGACKGMNYRTHCSKVRARYYGRESGVGVGSSRFCSGQDLWTQRCQNKVLTAWVSGTPNTLHFLPGVRTQYI